MGERVTALDAEWAAVGPLWYEAGVENGGLVSAGRGVASRLAMRTPTRSASLAITTCGRPRAAAAMIVSG